MDPSIRRAAAPEVRRRVQLALAAVAACGAVAIAAHYDGAALEALEAARAQLGWGTRERLGRLADLAEILGQGWLTAPLALAIYCFDPRGRERVAVFVATLLAVMLAVNVAKVATGRRRPKAIEKLAGAPPHVWLGPRGGIDDPRARSFPSGHTATAVAHATVLSALYPPATPLLVLLAAPVPVSRVLMRSHFVSDVVAGALLALFLTRLLSQSVRFRKACARLAARLPVLSRHREATPPAAVSGPG
jgi:membrane-associated phospholipid phosphatase